MRPLKRSYSAAQCETVLASKQSKDMKNDGSKMHRRSRSGCYTCRLRRKKCDESRPFCRACKHLGVDCEYSRPKWWVNADHRRDHKEKIKEIIKQTKLAEKPHTQLPRIQQITPPPSLCYSVPSSVESTGLTRAASLYSQFSTPPDYDALSGDFFGSTPVMPLPQWNGAMNDFPRYPPFEIDVKTERQTFVNDIPTRTDSTISTFSVLHPPPSHIPLNDFNDDGWIQQEFYESQTELLTEEPIDFHFFDHAHEPVTSNNQAVIEVEEADQYLLDHFLQNIAPFPILDVNQHGSAKADVILPALAENKCYLHCCLSIAALHIKTTSPEPNEEIVHDIIRHRAATISELCEAFQNDADHAQIIEAALGLVYFQSSVGSIDDTLPDIPWHQHFLAVTNLIQELEFTASLQDDSRQHSHAVFNITLASWIDILGATMLRSAPVFCSSYRQKIEHNLPTGLLELMGCDDRVMYLISEIACLDNLKTTGSLDDFTLCQLITNLGEQLSLTESGAGDVGNVYAAATGAIRPKQLSKNITAVFRLAARIHLCSLVPDFDSQQTSIVSLVAAVTETMEYIPTDGNGFDRSLVWPLLIAGSVAGPESKFRTLFSERCAMLGASSDFGSFGRLKELLTEVWSVNDDAVAKGEKPNIHWRDVMQQKGWDFLLI